jgi:hypothetical protein
MLVAEMQTKPEWFIDSMVQATRSHLPADLKGAAKAIGLTQKQDAGKALIKLFAVEGNGVTPQSHPEEWAAFRSYARDDVAAMRDVFFATMPLSRRMWEEYWTSERINHRGVAVDLPFVRGAAALAKKLTETANADIEALTGGAIRTVNQHAAILDWVRYELRHLPEVDRILTSEFEMEEDEDGERVSVAKYSLGRKLVEALMAYLKNLNETEGLTDEEWTVLQVLEIRLFGAGATPKKYQKILDNVDHDGRLKGQFIYGGAAATIRFSSKGVQVHNLARSTVGKLDDEIDAIEMITEKGADAYDAIKARWGYVGKVLSYLIRPAFVAPQGKTLVFVDWSSIQAIICPWITDDEDAQPLLDAVRANHKDLSLPDLYKVQAGKMLGKDPLEITKSERQAYGKTVQLGFQFLGGENSLHAMGRIYGVTFTDEEAAEAKERWRADNQWAVRFGEKVWDGVLWCMDNPGEPRVVGRMTLVYDPKYLKGTLFAVMPNGDPLLYTGIAWREVTSKDKTTGEEKTDTRLTVRKGRGVMPIWKGEFCLAADTQVLTDSGWKPIVDIGLTDLVWDGVEFVTHDGLCFQGKKHTIPLNGVRMTPDHKVLTGEGWHAAAQCEGFYGAAVRMPDSDTTNCWCADEGPLKVTDGEVAVSVRLRVGGREDSRRSSASSETRRFTVGGALWTEETERRSQDAQHVESSGLHRVEKCETEMRTADCPSMEELRRSRDSDERFLAALRDVLGGHGADLAGGADLGPYGQRRSLRTRQLPLGRHDDSIAQPTRCARGEHACAIARNGDQRIDALLSVAPEPVYDLLNAGPRSRFVVRGDSGPFVVSNCNNFVQGCEAAMLRSALVKLEERGLPVVLHVHDDICVEVDADRAQEVKDAMLEVMCANEAWTEGLPIAAEPTVWDWYTKCLG